MGCSFHVHVHFPLTIQRGGIHGLLTNGRGCSLSAHRGGIHEFNSQLERPLYEIPGLLTNGRGPKMGQMDFLGLPQKDRPYRMKHVT